MWVHNRLKWLNIEGKEQGLISPIGERCCHIRLCAHSFMLHTGKLIRLLGKGMSINCSYLAKVKATSMLYSVHRDRTSWDSVFIRSNSKPYNRSTIFFTKFIFGKTIFLIEITTNHNKYI